MASDQTTATSRRAALATWVSGGVLLLLSTCCVGSLMLLGGSSMTELQQLDRDGQLPEEAWRQLQQIKPYLPVISAVLAATTMLPAAALLVLGFAVRKGAAGPTKAAWLICWAALILVGLNIFFSLPAVISSGPGGLLNLLPSIALGMLLWWAVTSLRRSRDDPARDASPVDLDRDPWEP